MDNFRVHAIYHYYIMLFDLLVRLGFNIHLLAKVKCSLVCGKRTSGLKTSGISTAPHTRLFIKKWAQMDT